MYTISINVSIQLVPIVLIIAVSWCARHCKRSAEKAAEANSLRQVISNQLDGSDGGKDGRSFPTIKDRMTFTFSSLAPFFSGVTFESVVFMGNVTNSGSCCSNANAA